MNAGMVYNQLKLSLNKEEVEELLIGLRWAKNEGMVQDEAIHNDIKKVLEVSLKLFSDNTGGRGKT